MCIRDRYKSILAYMFFGVCTTAVNLIIYFLCSRVMNFSTIFSTVVAWFIAVIFAFVTNKAWVFESKSWKREIIGKELTSFFACRIATGILDVVVMMVTVDILLMNDVIKMCIRDSVRADREYHPARHHLPYLL